MKRRLKDVRREARVFLKRYPDATSDEIDALYEWMQDGHSPYENGDGVYDDSCRTMDFINTLRFWDSMYQEWLENPESFAERYLSSNNAADNTTTDFQEPRNDNLPF